MIRGLLYGSSYLAPAFKRPKEGQVEQRYVIDAAKVPEYLDTVATVSAQSSHCSSAVDTIPTLSVAPYKLHPGP